MTKSKSAAEKDDVEAVERYAGRVAYLLDKVVALVKVRALAMEARMDDVSDPEPDPLGDSRLSKDFRNEVTAELAQREEQLAEKRATSKVWRVEDEILRLDMDREVSVMKGVSTSVR